MACERCLIVLLDPVMVCARLGGEVWEAGMALDGADLCGSVYMEPAHDSLAFTSLAVIHVAVHVLVELSSIPDCARTHLKVPLEVCPLLPSAFPSKNHHCRHGKH